MRFVPLLALIALLLHGCAQMPAAIREPEPAPLSLLEARQAPQAPVGTRVRWGGTIANVDNRKTETWIEIVDRPLDSSGRPRQTDASGGRFLARVAGFLDPAVYSEGRQITVTGTVQDRITRTVGQFPYAYVVVDVSGHYLWAPLPERPPAYYYDPLFYDPFWPGPFWHDPWYPWPYPYHRYR